MEKNPCLIAKMRQIVPASLRQSKSTMNNPTPKPEDYKLQSNCIIGAFPIEKTPLSADAKPHPTFFCPLCTTLSSIRRNTGMKYTQNVTMVQEASRTWGSKHSLLSITVSRYPYCCTISTARLFIITAEMAVGFFPNSMHIPLVLLTLTAAACVDQCDHACKSRLPPC